MMLRELSRLLDELHDGLLAVEARGGVQLAGVEMTLPLELRPVLRDGGCVLLADVPRSRGPGDWQTAPSKLRLAWGGAVEAEHRRDDGHDAGTHGEAWP
ncbi:hypothetical protein [Marilutibacter chinensis]|uniref:Uncharacterized protein n=1 Tax=Marilutibacter chinensis TaxID=2912247 RepID=A0ABS9HRY0_9GAMM|nr:hypothetical protein [Lysobacter chinensis]MCF7220877.1 hypothetical protein [Lysobacter chinensis]